VAHLFRPVTVKPIPRAATVRTVKGRPVACWVARGGRQVAAPLTPDGTRCRVESPTWWVEYTGAGGGACREKGFRDRGATLQLAARLEEKARAVRGGYEAPDREGPTPLGAHLADFRRHLTDKGCTPAHAHNVLRYVRTAAEGCGLTTPAAVDVAAVARWLAGERDRLGWSADGYNRRAGSLRQFGRWLVRTGRAKWNPFEALPGVGAKGAKSRVRRRLDHEHLLFLIATTRASAVDREKLSGPDRAALYLAAAYTGFRRSALRSLTPESFAWDAGVPTSVTVAAAWSKSRHRHTVPLHPGVAAELAAWLRGRAPGVKLWRGGYRSAEMLAADMADARAAWVAAGRDREGRADREASDVLLTTDHAGEVFDFHSLRVQYISGLALAGVPLTAAQKLADHSTPVLTANVYGRWGKELAGEVAKLPGLGAQPDARSPQPLGSGGDAASRKQPQPRAGSAATRRTRKRKTP
jgi:integrase